MMKLYDVIRKENMDRDILAPTPEPEVHEIHLQHKKKISPRKIITIALVVVFIALLYIVGMKVVRAKVIIYERHIPFTIEDVELELVHEKEASPGRLSFQAMVVPTEVTRQVYGGNVAPSTSSARGKVVFFNEYSKGSQTVKAKTVITGANGKKYQTVSAVTVPGFTTVAGKKSAGTSAATAVVASAIGESYNTNGTSFTVAGWTGSKAKLFYAQSAGAITGGEDGALHTVSEEDRDDVVATLNAQLIERLKRETRAQIPEDLITYPDLQFTSVDSDSLVLRGSTIKFPASIKGTMVTYLISRDLLESTIASKVVHDRSYANVSIPALNDLIVVPTTPIPTDPTTIPESIKVTVSGSGVIITKAPTATILQSLLGRKKKDFTEALSAIPEVGSATYRLYPFWAPFFPTRENRIYIEVE